VSFSVAPELASIVCPGVLWLEGATIAEREPRLDAPLAAVAAAMRRGVGLPPPHPSGASASLADSIGADENGFRLQAEEVRTMYKRVGLDPTKRRPSSEALLRRVRKGEPLPRINSMVDVCNWCSLEFQLPYGLYDAAMIQGDVVLRLGASGESYAGIRKDDVHVGGRIALADALGPFGNPTSDSARTMVTTATTRAMVVVFAPTSVDASALARVLDLTSARMREFTGCREVGRM
jgi:DNA/RNA-binding domain of Phe-tRNA-synthetase-like protein